MDIGTDMGTVMTWWYEQFLKNYNMIWWVYTVRHGYGIPNEVSILPSNNSYAKPLVSKINNYLKNLYQILKARDSTEVTFT